MKDITNYYTVSSRYNGYVCFRSFCHYNESAVVTNSPCLIICTINNGDLRKHSLCVYFHYGTNTLMSLFLPISIKSKERICDKINL